MCSEVGGDNHDLVGARNCSLAVSLAFPTLYFFWFLVVELCFFFLLRKCRTLLTRAFLKLANTDYLWSTHLGSDTVKRCINFLLQPFMFWPAELISYLILSV